MQAAHVAALTCMVQVGRPMYFHVVKNLLNLLPSQMYTHVSQLADSVDSSLRARSMTICLSAARTSARVLEDLRIRGGLLQLPPLPSVVRNPSDRLRSRAIPDLTILYFIDVGRNSGFDFLPPTSRSRKRRPSSATASIR